jgi:hypothetical protein
MHLFACSACRLARSLTSGRRQSHRSALRHLIPLAGAAGLMILVSACASGSPHPANATGAQPQHTTKAAAAASPRAAATAASPPAPTASPPTTSSPGTTGSTGTTSSTPPAYTGPDFTTAQAAMAYLAAAYNSDDTTAMHAVTTSQAFTALLAMHSSDVNLQVGSCTARAQGDYICSFRYTYAYTTASGQNSQTRSAMAIVAPALNPGWYMYNFIFGCD